MDFGHALGGNSDYGTLVGRGGRQARFYPTATPDNYYGESAPSHTMIPTPTVAAQPVPPSWDDFNRGNAQNRILQQQNNFARSVAMNNANNQRQLAINYTRGGRPDLAQAANDQAAGYESQYNPAPQPIVVAGKGGNGNAG